MFLWVRAGEHDCVLVCEHFFFQLLLLLFRFNTAVNSINLIGFLFNGSCCTFLVDSFLLLVCMLKIMRDKFASKSCENNQTNHFDINSTKTKNEHIHCNQDWCCCRYHSRFAMIGVSACKFLLAELISGKCFVWFL